MIQVSLEELLRIIGAKEVELLQLQGRVAELDQLLAQAAETEG